MEAIRERCAGLDVHQANVVACIMWGPLDRKPKREIRTFPSTTPGLMKLADWLTEHECQEVAMESTGIYWKPVWNILETEFKLTLGNAQRIKNTPGRKTDVKDAEWICQLHRCGMIQPSHVPPRDIREARDYTRLRRKMVQAATSQKNRIHKVLQDANVKLSTYVTDLFGKSGRDLLQSLINGEVLTAEQVRDIVRGSLKKKVPDLVDALNSRLTNHHRELLDTLLRYLLFLDTEIAQLEEKIKSLLQPYTKELALLDTIPGIDQDGAADILAEIGPDMSAFPTEHHAASWATMCPGQNKSAGKNKGGKTGKGNKYLRSALCQAANANVRCKDTRLSLFYRNVLRRKGHSKAIIALGHLILRIAYHLLKKGYTYEELGDRFTRKRKEKSLDKLVKQIEQMGYQVKVTTA